MDKTMIQQRTGEPRDIPKRIQGETLHRYFSIMRTRYDTHGRCVITFDGHADAERMGRAVRLTLDVQPILGCRFVEHPWRPYWERRVDLDRIPTFSVTVPKDLDWDLGQFMGASIDPAEGPQVQTRLFHCEHDILCIKINHMVADAGGLLEYANLLARTYCRLGQNPNYVPTSCSDARCGQAEVLKQVGLLKSIRAGRHFSLPPAKWQGKAPHQDLSGRKFLIRRIGPERVAAIKAYGRQRQIPLNHILLTAYYRALFQVIDLPVGIPLPIQVTVSLRRYLKPNPSSSISNLVGAFFPRITRKPNTSFEDTLTQLHSVMQAADVAQPWLGQVLLAEFAFSAPFAIIRSLAHRVLTLKSGPPIFPPVYANLGIIDPDQVDFGNPRVADVAMVGPVEYPPTRTLTISTFRETMVLSTSFCDNAPETKHAQCLLDGCINELPL